MLYQPRYLRPLIAVVALAACSRNTRSPLEPPDVGPKPSTQTTPLESKPNGSTDCGNATGAWSPVVDGLRGRMVTSGARVDRTELGLTVEIENTTNETLEINWSGRPEFGFLSFRLDDAMGVEIPEPSWRLGGNEPTGDIRELIGPHAVVRHLVGTNIFTPFNGRRIVRIGAFWARPMPADGTRLFLRATASGSPPHSSPPTLLQTGVDGGLSLGRDPAGSQRGRPWRGPLDLPSVCVQ